MASQVSTDPALASFFAWFEALGAPERNFVLAAPMNKIRPLLQRSAVRNVIAAPRATFTLRDALADRLVVLVHLPEGVLGPDATGLIGQVVLARLWSAVQGRARADARSPYFVTVDEAPRFVDQPTDLGDVLARAREYGVGVTLIAQALSQLPTDLREVALNSARTKVAFQSSAADARRLAAEFGPLVTPDMLQGLAAYEAVGAVSVGGAVSEPFTFRTRALEPPVRGRAAAVRRASRERWGLPRHEIEASFSRHQQPPSAVPVRSVGGQQDEQPHLSGRPSGRGSRVGPFLHVRRGARGRKRDDIRARAACAMSTTCRISYERLTRLEGELTQRDRAILETVARLHLVTGQHLLRVHWPEPSPADERAARRTLQRLTRWRVLARLERRMGGLGRGSTSWTYALDVAGQRLMAAGGRDARRPHLPRPAMWQHALTVSEVYTRLVEATRGTQQRLSRWQGEPDSWRRFAGPYGEPLLVKPDAYVEVTGPDFADLYFLEIDTGSQSRPVIRRKLDAYRRYAASGIEQATEGVFPRVVFLTPEADRHALLIDLLGELPSDVWPLFTAGLVSDSGRMLAGQGTDA